MRTFAKPAAAQTVTVTDPDKVWRSSTPADLGCPTGGILDWGRKPGAGASAEAAVNDLLPRLTTDGRPLTVNRAPVGYPDAAKQTWIAYFADGKAHMVIDVSPSSTGFTAGPEILCAN